MRAARSSRPSFSDWFRTFRRPVDGPPLPLLPHPLDALPAAINHLLAEEPWARAQLVPHANKTIFVVIRPVTIKLCIAPDGTVARAAPDAIANTTVTLPSSALSRILGGRSQALIDGLRVDGDADLARAVSLLVRHLRWDVEDDLSKVVGDAVAHRVVGAARSAQAQAARANRKVAAGVSEYLLDEQPQLVRPRAVEEHAARLRTLRDDLARLEKRIDRLSPTGSARA